MGRWHNMAVQLVQKGAVSSVTVSRHPIEEAKCTNCTGTSESQSNSLFINGDPHGECLNCGHEITDADKPDCIPVSGSRGTSDRYLCPSLQCYRKWLSG
jgi:Zn ribbon nucleic-acid-binding protein